MKPINLTKTIKSYKSGWVAVDERKKKVIAHARTFEAITKKAKEMENIFIMPAAKNYFGYITRSNA